MMDLPFYSLSGGEIAFFFLASSLAFQDIQEDLRAQFALHFRITERMDIIFLVLLCSAGFPYYRGPAGGPVKRGISYSMTSTQTQPTHRESGLHHTSSRIQQRQKRRWARGKRCLQEALQEVSPHLFLKVLLPLLSEVMGRN